MIELDLIKFSGRVLEVAPTVCGFVGDFVDDTWGLQMFTFEVCCDACALDSWLRRSPKVYFEPRSPYS